MVDSGIEWSGVALRKVSRAGQLMPGGVVELMVSQAGKPSHSYELSSY